ncbi:HET-domain-containing protein, partial [Stipitochalara longipes BDJ]
MRLLNVNTMRLEEYFGSRIPDYSILSHCWGADEIGFQDINRPNWRSMRGAAKIESACTVSRRQNETYIWIDTCCIDKSSSAELSEAINSMYNWYQRATQCFAYLEDVSGTLFLDDPTEIDENAMDEIQRSRWFRRGWTLQELIAPRSVLFLNKEWNPLGERSSLSRLLSSITTVPEDILSEPEDITSCSIARKMSWAASRETSREEDMAYCLLGIFGVNMPLLYGEGMGAFIRLQEEILKESDDQSIFAWSLTDPLLPPLLPGRVIIPGNNKEGVLANHPAHFAGSANIVPFPSEPERQPFSMTNRGLRIELRVLNYRNIRREQLVGILDCHYKDDFSSAIGIYL